MKKVSSFLAGALVLVTTTNVSADEFDKRVSVGAIAGTTGFGGDISWRFHKNLALTARYTDGLDLNTDYEDDGVNYEADFGMKASSLKVDYFPFGGRFFISAGAMMPDIEAGVKGTPDSGTTYELNGSPYAASDLGSIVGTATVADGTQPYLGWGWRSSNTTGFGFFSEFGVVATDVNVSLRTTEGFENGNANANSTFRDDLRAEEQSLKDDIDKLPVFPVALLGISYTF